MNKKGRWTTEEFEYLKENIYKKSLDEISEYLQRDKKHIKNKASLSALTQNNYLTDVEKELIKQWYATHDDELKLDELSQIMKRTPELICRTANKMKLTKFGRKPRETIKKSTERLNIYNQTDEGIKNRAIALEKANDICAKNPDLRKGMKGKTHTTETKKQISENTKKYWADPNSKFNSVEHRQKKSDLMAQSQKSNIGLRNGYSRGNQGKRADLDNLYVRSSWEANYARYLKFLQSKGEIYKWEYEPDTFWFEKIKRGTRSYLPDFKIWETENSKPYYVEVKGWLDDKSKTKLKRMAKYYPNIKVELFAEKEYKELKKWARLIPFWE